MHEKDEDKLCALAPLFEKLGYAFYPKYGGYNVRGKLGCLDILTMKVENGMVYFANERHLLRWGKREGIPIHYKVNELFPLKEYLFGDFMVMGPQNPIPFLDCFYGEEWSDYARYKREHKGKYSSVRVRLTEELKRPAKQSSSLEDRVKSLL